MVLARHIDAEEVVEQCKSHRHTKHVDGHDLRIYHQTPTRDVAQDIPKYTLPKTGVAAAAAYQMIHDEMALDGTPVLNLASFVHTWMPPEADKLIMENLNKNAVDMDEYPATQVMQARCVSMIADLWKVPKGSKAIGTATAGSSEAIMLGGLAMKKTWQAKRIAAGKDHYHPNIVFGANAQVALEKFARYFDVECRLVPVTEESDFVMDPAAAMQFIDENTIGVMVILGSTYTGAFEDVQKMSDLLDEYEKKTGLSIPIHVDAASGGFVAPFAYPNLKWSFDVPRVVSINTSGHKYGGVYVGLGWIIWKDETLLPKELIFELHYLGSTEYSYTLNFSHPAFPVISQMFNFLNLGYEGYQTIALRDLANARLLSRALESTYFKVLSNIHKPLKQTAGIFDKALATLALAETDEALQCNYGLPVVAFRFSDAFKSEYPHVQQVWVQTLLRGRGWIVPNYNAPPKEEKVEILRVVVRETMSADLVERLIKDILEVTESLMGQTPEFAMMATTSAVSAAAKLEHETHGKMNASTRPDVGHARPDAKRLPKRQATLAMQC